MKLLGRNKMSVLLEYWSEVDLEVKTSIWTDVVVFILTFMICFTSIYEHFFV